jgi:hypothetical protein
MRDRPAIIEAERLDQYTPQAVAMISAELGQVERRYIIRRCKNLLWHPEYTPQTIIVAPARINSAERLYTQPAACVPNQSPNFILRRKGPLHVQ